MSSQTQEDEPEGLFMYLQRMKTALLSRSDSDNQPGAAAPESIAFESPSNSPVSFSIAPAAESTPPSHEYTGAIDRSTTQRERARVLLARYGLNLEPEGLKPLPDIKFPRVNRTILIRVRRTCHRCQTVFGPNTVCINCQHPRCKNCPRFPTKNEGTDESLYMNRTRIAEICARRPATLPMTPHLKFTGNPAAPLTMQSPTGGSDHVRKPVVQRVRRMCHACDTTFKPGTTECASCAHVRCKKCPRDPHNPEKYPNGYPGDAEPSIRKPERTFRKPRQRVHYICHVCKTDFNKGASTCGKCGQAKCAETVRNPPKRTGADLDLRIMRSVEEKMAILRFTDT
ncbi:hypothetical protein PDE_07576 [Penicillium oxalicum 114-2]|uniref:Uncharacterized protein n=1 Tax=Penicillium oxalicum (strain 114-2 / CGMCC 5302) TaxID=933388 RepID=S7ZV29_PENO1|nr:hypothetical protein PDE_07576 [Penicillium oxalicum 114-2]